MKALFLIVTLLASPLAIAQTDLEGKTYVTTSFGCATPPSGRYQLAMTQTFTNYDVESDSIERQIVVTAQTAPTSPYRGACTVSYQGYYQWLSETTALSQLTRVSCQCSGAFERAAEKICSGRVDAFMLESDGSQSEVLASGSDLATRQLGTPENAYEGCGDQYPQFTLRQK